MTRMIRCSSSAPLLGLAIAALFTVATPLALAAEWPSFEPGQWQIERSMDGMGSANQKISRTQCMDPTADLAAQRQQLSGSGCEFSELTGGGTTFHYTATCKIGNLNSISKSVLEVGGDDAFTITIDSDANGMKAHEVMTARRVGDCP